MSSTAVATKRPLRLLFVHLADHEWGNETMQQVAREEFARDESLNAIEVREHGGWWLMYAPQASLVRPTELLIIGSANDQAQFPQQAKDYLAQFSEWQYVDTVVRPELPKS